MRNAVDDYVARQYTRSIGIDTESDTIRVSPWIKVADSEKLNSLDGSGDIDSIITEPSYKGLITSAD